MDWVHSLDENGIPTGLDVDFLVASGVEQISQFFVVNLQICNFDAYGHTVSLAFNLFLPLENILQTHL